MSGDDDGVETAEFNDEYHQRQDTHHKTIEEPSTPTEE